MNILVTGCAGFIGSKVSELLLKEGHTVIGVDNLNQAYDPRLKEWRLKQLQSYPLFQFHSLDISHWTEMDELFNKICGPGEHSVSAVINLAARAEDSFHFVHNCQFSRTHPLLGYRMSAVWAAPGCSWLLDCCC